MNSFLGVQILMPGSVDRSSQEPVAGKVTDPRAEPTTVVLLNGRLSDCLLNTSIYTHRLVSLSAFIRAHACKV